VTTLRSELEAEVAFPTESIAAARGDRTLQRAAKRALDVAGALMAIVVLALPALVVAIAIRLDSRGPVFLRQWRVGRNGEPFRMFKFRTMCDGADGMKVALSGQNEQQGPLFKMRADPRMTRVGRWLRKSSIDELPQILNVFAGHMSLVGPRPPLPAEVQLYTPYQLGRLAAKPGMTGLWQVSGRSLLTFDRMVDLDRQYIAEWTFTGDVLILLRTVPAVLSGRGAY
jgi:lipopolysaccharide/colanic/teichoic acid biosynthesis glycosyltransferase